MLYICCRQCMEDPNRAKEPMRSYGRLSVSMTEGDTELMIWCNRHNCEVARIGVGGYSRMGVDGYLRLIPPGVLGQKTFHEERLG